MEFSRPEHWSGFPSLGDLPNSGIEPGSPALQVNSLPSEPVIQEIVISVKIRFVGFFFPVFPPCSSLKIACREVKMYLDN